MEAIAMNTRYFAGGRRCAGGPSAEWLSWAPGPALSTASSSPLRPTTLTVAPAGIGPLLATPFQMAPATKTLPAGSSRSRASPSVPINAPEPTKTGRDRTRIALRITKAKSRSMDPLAAHPRAGGSGGDRPVAGAALPDGARHEDAAGRVQPLARLPQCADQRPRAHEDRPRPHPDRLADHEGEEQEHGGAGSC